jgi:hypothetical protein
MRFRNPWIDPRIVHVATEHARAYLLQHGWKSLGPAANPIFEMFERPGNGEGRPSVLVPLQLDEGPMLQRMIDLVSDLAQLEDRWAVAVLDDMLQAKTAESARTNGPGVSGRGEPAAR